MSFDQDGVRDLENAINYLTSDKVQETGNEKVEKLRAKIISDKYKSLSFNLSIFGDLTYDAHEKFKKLERDYTKENIEINLYTWKELINEIKGEEKYGKDINHEFNVFEGQLLTSHDYCYFLAHSKDFAEAFRKYGWALFDMNVRAELRNSPVNKQIIKSLTHDKSMKYFNHLNNGILIFCNSYKKIPKKNPEKLKVNEFQVINGCQTVLSIYRALEKLSRDEEKYENFCQNCKVQVKVIRKNEQTEKLISDIVLSTNTQNKMSLRNLKSNSNEQIEIKKKFDNLPKKWFYQRKDGEFLSYSKEPVFNFDFKFRITDYKENKTERYLDNEEMGKAWLNYIGFSSKTMMQKKIFSSDNLYEKIFLSTPSEKLWQDFKDPDIQLTKKSEDYFEYGKTPSAEEYLLSYIIWKFINNYTVNPRKNKSEAIERLVKKGKLHRNSDNNIQEPKEKYMQELLDDREYMRNSIINNCKEVYTEMYSFVLVNKYGYGYKVAKDILNHHSVKQLYHEPDFQEYIEKNMKKDPSNILYSIYEMIKHSLGQLYTEIKSDYLAAPRRKAFLADPDFIQKFKKRIIKENESSHLKSYADDWILKDKDFFSSLPDL